jgi:glycosyltransferase involved in cell wall biosynthesis
MREEARGEVGGDRPRIVDVVPRIQLRGAEIFAQHLEVALRDRYRARLLALYAGGERFAWTGTGRPVDWASGVRRGPLRFVRAAKSLRDRALAFEPRIVVAHGGDPLRVAAAAGLHRIAPLVYVRVAAVTPDLRTPARSRTLRWAYGKVDAFVAVSESLRRELVDVFEVPGSKIRVIPNGRPPTPEPTDEQRDEIRRSLGLKPGEILAVWAGRFVREKDPVAAAGLARRLHALAPEARLVIVGGGPLDRDVRAAVDALDPAARPVLTGEREDAPRLIAAADLLVSTSRTEGVPGVFVEALLVGVPVVAHDMGGVRDVVTDETGALVPPDDAEGLAVAVASLVTDPAARAKAAHAARSAGVRLDIARVADEYDALFRELLARPR